MAKRLTKRPKRKESWVEPFVKNVQVPGVEATYSAANLEEKFVWVLFLVVCIVFTGVNVYLASKEFFDNPVVTKATAVLHVERRPPDMQLCLPFDHYYVFGHTEGTKCVQQSFDFENVLKNVTASINSKEDFLAALASNNIFARKALIMWILQYDGMEFFAKHDREAEKPKKESVEENYTEFDKIDDSVLLMTSERYWNGTNQGLHASFYLALDAHLRSAGITLEYAWELYSNELLTFFNPQYRANLSLDKLEFPSTTMRTGYGTKQSVICLRLLLKKNVKANKGKGLVRITIDHAASTFPACNPTESPQPILPPYITVQPYDHNLALGRYTKILGVPGKLKVVHLGIRAEYESDPNGGCLEHAPDIDLCHLQCRYRYIRYQCRCRPPLAHRGTLTFEEEDKLKNVTTDEGMRECNLTDYFRGNCYIFNTDGTEDDEDRCRRACKQNCTNTQWEFTGEQVVDFGKNTTELQIEFGYFSYPHFKSEPKVTWFNVMSDVGGALGLFLGLSIFSVIHTLMLPIHLFMKNRKAKRKQAVVLNDISVVRQLHDIRKATKAAEPTETETTDKPQGE